METFREKKEAAALIETYESHGRAEDAVFELKRGGFDMKKLSILAKDFESREHVIGFYNAGDRIKTWGKFGALWGGIWGMLFGSGMFLIPGLGPVLVAGSFAAILVATLEGAAVVAGLSALGAALYGLGIPKDSVLRYEKDLNAGKFLLLAHGTHQEIENARNILESSQIKSGRISVAS